MVHGAVSVFLRMLGGVAFLLLIAAGLLAWRLDQGPLPLSTLTPYVEDLLSARTDEFDTQVGNAYLYWESAGRALDLRVSDVVAVDADGNVLAAVPELAVTLDPWGLLQGRIRFRSVEVLRPHLQLVRARDGRVSLGMWSPDSSPAPEASDEVMSSEAVLRALVAGVSAGPEDAGDGTVSRLNAVRIVNATATLHDRRLGVVWRLPRADVEMYRGDGGKVGVAARLDLKVGAGTTKLDVVGAYRPDGRHLETEVSFAGLNPATLSALSDDLAPLAAVDLPLDGSARVVLTVADVPEVRDVTLDLTGGAGTLHLPAPIATDYPVAQLTLNAAVAQAGRYIRLDRLRATLADGPEVAASGTLAPAADGGVAGEVTARVRALPVDTLRTYWPQTIGVNPRRWVTQNLRGGRLTEGRWTFTLAGASPAALDVADLRGTAEVEGVEVAYLAPMPPLENVAATLTFEGLKAIDIRSRQGGVYDLRLTDATVRLVGLDGGTETAEIDLRVTGPVADALKLIDHQPLGYPTRLGLDTAGAAGQAVTALKMNFPLLDDLRLEDVGVAAEAELTDLVLRGVVQGRDLTGGNLSLNVTAERLDAQGQAFVAGIPAGFTWRENFDGQPFRSRYRVRTVMDDAQRRTFGLDAAPLMPPYLSGPARAELELTYFDDDRTTLGAQVDLRETRLHVPGFNWTKAPGAPAQASVSVRLGESGIRDVPRFTITADGLEVGGRMALTEAGALDRLTLTRFILDETSLTADLVRDGNGFRAEVGGAFLDARPLLNAKDEDGAAREARTADDMPPLTVHAKVDAVRLADEGMIHDARARVERVDGRWRAVRLQGVPEGGKPFIFVLGPEARSDRRSFIARTDDAGRLLRAAGLIGTVRGGKLQADGTVTGDGLAEGKLVITDYRLVDAPLLARLLSVAALTGILDALTGEGLAFDRLEAPFTLKDGLLTLTDFRTHGSSLGLTADGTVDIDRRVVDLGGTLVPAYVLNSLFGKIPLLGDLFTGFEKGGGVFAANYTVRGPVSAPEIGVNPLSALAPGFLRKLFSLITPSGGGEPTEGPARPEVPAVPSNREE